MAGVSSSVFHRDGRAEGGTAYDGVLNVERVGERMDIVGPLGVGPAFFRATIAPPGATLIEINDLRDAREIREPGLPVAAVHRGSAVEQDQRRLLAHGGAIGHELGAFDVEKEADA